MAYRRSVVVLAMAALGGVLAGCPMGDPEGPGARGVVSLGEGVSTSERKTLRVRAVPASDTPFDPDNPQFPGPDLDGDDRWLTHEVSLEGLSFPQPYEIGAVLGITDHERWRVFAWLSADEIEEQSDAPRSGEPYGTTTVDIDSCGLSYGGYCTVTEGVDVTLDQTAP